MRILSHYFGREPGLTRRVLVLTLVNNIAFGMYLALVPIYLVQVAHLSVALAGTSSALSGAAMVTVAPFSGRFADSHQPRLVGAVTRAFFGLSAGLLTVVHAFAAVAVLTVTGAVLITMARNVGSVIVASAGGEQPAEFRARARSVAGIGQTLAAGMVAVVLSIGGVAAYDTGLALIVGLGIASAFILMSLPDIPREPGRTAKGASRREWAVLRDYPYLAIVALAAVFRFSYSVEQVGLPLWIITHTDLAKPWRAFFMAVDALFVMGFAVQIGRRIDSVRTAGRTTALSGALFPVAYLGIAATGWTHGWRSAPLLAGLTLFYAVASSLYHSAEITLSMSLAPAGRRGEYLSMISSVEGVSQIAGPILMSAVVVTFREAGWLVIGAIFATAGLLAIPVTAMARPKERHRLDRSNSPDAGVTRPRPRAPGSRPAIRPDN
jgi:MFS family permease